MDCRLIGREQATALHFGDDRVISCERLKPAIAVSVGAAVSDMGDGAPAACI